MTTEVSSRSGANRLNNNNENNFAKGLSEEGEEDRDCNDNGGTRKPSYVGLSRAVSGYGSYSTPRYPSPSRKTSPSQIHVSSEPQTLDAALNNFASTHRDMIGRRDRLPPPARGQTEDKAGSFSTSYTRKIVESGNLATLETVKKYYSPGSSGDGLREGSPGSDCSGSSSIGSAGSGGGGGTLVQKQIERLYGGRVLPVRVTSPEPKDELDKSVPCHGYFAKRMSPDGEGPLHHVKDLKSPAVFRLLRPEFREQLKTHSCQVIIPTEPNNASSSSYGTPVSSSSYRVTTSNYSRSRGGDRNVPITTRHVLENYHNNNNNNGSSVHVTKAGSAAVKERVIPIQLESSSGAVTNGNHSEAARDGGRMIPVQRASESNNNKMNGRGEIQEPSKPALPAKPLSPPAQKAPLHVVTSPTLVAKAVSVAPKVKTVAQRGTDEGSATKRGEAAPEVEVKPEPPKQEEDTEEYVEENESEEFYNSSPPCGMRERALLCPIQEEDAESTASTNSFLPSKTAAANGAVTNTNGSKEEVHDGHYFIKVLENEIFKFEEQICDFEEDLSSPEQVEKMTDDVRDSILATNGKAKLLMSQKLVQFRGLCDKNINLSHEEDPFVPTPEDLAGFWDMVYIQVEHIHALFAELRTLRKNGWKSDRPLRSSSSSLLVAKGESSPPKKPVKKVRTPEGKANGKAGGKSEAAKARDEARKKMMEERRRMMREKKAAAADKKDGEVEMFVAVN